MPKKTSEEGDVLLVKPEKQFESRGNIFQTVDPFLLFSLYHLQRPQEYMSNKPNLQAHSIIKHVYQQTSVSSWPFQTQSVYVI